jgi:FkbM family methyltransferase
MIDFIFRGQEFHFVETPQAQACINEIFSDNYHVLNSVEKGIIEFKPGDIVLDLGANEGMFSIMMAKLFPDVQIYAFEPVPETFNVFKQNLYHNIQDFSFDQIHPHNQALGSSPGWVDLICHNVYSGGASSEMEFEGRDDAFWLDHETVRVHQVSLMQVFEWYGFRSVKLMKFDMEGAEWNVFVRANYESSDLAKYLNMIRFAVGEIHVNRRLEELGCKPGDLAGWLASQTKLLFWEYCRMAD